jgi:hypothetical protein
MSDDMWPWEDQRLYQVEIKIISPTAHIIHPSAVYLTYSWKPELAKERAIQEVRKEKWWDPEKYSVHAFERKVLQ